LKNVKNITQFFMKHFFKFEDDFVDSLRCIPMQVRYKLDTCGVKLKLSDWNPLTPTERQALVDTPCTLASAQDYRSLIHRVVQAHTPELPADLPIDSQPPWMDETMIPESVMEKAEGAIALPQWIALTPLQRFALIKLSRSQHENKNFLPALKEFGLL
jgi:hypothetical protein